MIFAINSLDKTNVHFGFKKTNSANKTQFFKHNMELKDTVSFSSRYGKKEVPEDIDPWVTTYLNPSDDDDVSRDWFGHIRESHENNPIEAEDIYGHHRVYNPDNRGYVYDEDDDD